MKKIYALLLNIRWIALGIALALTLGMGTLTHSTPSAPAHNDLSAIASSTAPVLLADDGGKTHGQETHGGKG